jgi:hypothetical protein
VSGPVHETLDERIDRVAAALTAVPADPGFGDRLAPRLAGQGREGGNRWLFTAAAATAVVVLALVVNDRRDQGGTAPQAPQGASAIASGPTFAPAPVDAAPAVAAEEPLVEQAVSAAAPAPEFIGSDVERPPAIAALAAPDGIGVDTLQLEALHITPVDVEQIDIASLEVREIDGFEEPKE